MNEDTEDLHRFIKAQEPVFENVIRELQAGEKRSHWMWFIFPQIVGLGHSSTAQYYAIRHAGEAKAYLAHSTLCVRLVECTEILIAHEGLSSFDIFGETDDMKLQSSMTLFANVSDSDSVFRQALDKYFDGEPDHTTLNILSGLRTSQRE